MKKYVLIIFSLFFVFSSADAASHREKKERWFDGPGKPKKHKCRRKAAEIVSDIAVSAVNATIEEYKKNRANR